MITNLQLVAYCKAMLNHPYWYGCFGQISTKSLYENKKKQYPIQYTWKLPAAQLGVRVFDCVGLIKGAIWSGGSPITPPTYNAAQDVSANGMYNACKVKGTDLKKMPDVAGLLVFKSGHVGVYIGGGYVIEAAGHKYGVIKTKLKERPFKKWGYCPWIKYEDEKPAETPKTPVNKDKYYPPCKSSFKSIVDALDSINVDSRYTFRKKIAAANGIKNYAGKPQQNIDMLNMLKAGKLKKAK